MNQVRVGILGQGRSGRDIHGYTLSKMSDKYKIVAVVDDLEERRRRAEREFHCLSYAHYSELFERRNDIDLIVNALPSALHVPVTTEFLNMGFNVLCEKPVARKVNDVDALIETSKRTGKMLAIFQNARFSPAFVKMRNVISSGVLGRIIQISISFSGFTRRWDWQTLKAMNGGSLLNTGPHPIDQALQFFGSEKIPQVVCRMDTVNSFGDAEDYVKVLLFQEGYPNVEVEISSCSIYPLSTYHVQGANGGLMGNTSHLEWRYFIPEEADKQEIIKSPLQKEDGTPAYCKETLTWYQESWDVPAEYDDELANRNYYEMLYGVLVNGDRLKVSLPEVRQQIAVMEECFHQNPRFNI